MPLLSVLVSFLCFVFYLCRIKSKKLRQERRERLSNKVRDIKEAMRNSEGDHLESDWSIPWLLVGFVVMLGYCAYYIIQ